MMDYELRIDFPKSQANASLNTNCKVECPSKFPKAWLQEVVHLQVLKMDTRQVLNITIHKPAFFSVDKAVL